MTTRKTILKKREFKYIGGTSRKFWTMEVFSRPAGAAEAEYIVKCSWGRIGSDPFYKNKSFYGQYAAETFANKKINEKLYKGYEEVIKEQPQRVVIAKNKKPKNKAVITTTKNIAAKKSKAGTDDVGRTRRNLEL